MALPRRQDTSLVLKDLINNRLTVVDNAVEPALQAVIVFNVTDAATSDIDIVLGTKVEVIDVVCRKDAGAGAANTMQVQTGAGVAISDVIACAVDKTITRAGTIDVANNVIAAGGTLRLHAVKAAGTRTARVCVHVLIRP